MRLIERVLHDLTVQTQSKVTVILTSTVPINHTVTKANVTQRSVGSDVLRSDMVNVYVIHGETNVRNTISLRVSLTVDAGYASLIVKMFQCRQSQTMRAPPDFLATQTMGLAIGLTDGRISPISNSSRI